MVAILITYLAGGWRVFWIDNSSGTIGIVHAGTPWLLNCVGGRDYTNLGPALNSLNNNALWRVFEDSFGKSDELGLAVPGSARSLTLSEIRNYNTTSNLRNIGACYAPSTSSYYTNKNGLPLTYHMYSIQANGGESDNHDGTWGARPVVTLKSNIKVTSRVGDKNHDTPETAWILSLEE